MNEINYSLFGTQLNELNLLIISVDLKNLQNKDINGVERAPTIFGNY